MENDETTELPDTEPTDVESTPEDRAGAARTRLAAILAGEPFATPAVTLDAAVDVILDAETADLDHACGCDGACACELATADAITTTVATTVGPEGVLSTTLPVPTTITVSTGTSAATGSTVTYDPNVAVSTGLALTITPAPTTDEADVVTPNPDVVCACPKFAGCGIWGVCDDCGLVLADGLVERLVDLGLDLDLPVTVDDLTNAALGLVTQAPAVLAIDPDNPGRFKSTMVVENEMTADGRIILKNATTWRATPLPLMLMTVTDDGHDGAQVCGVIEKISRSGAVITGEGRFDTSDAGVEAARLVRDRVLTAVSIDGGDVRADVVVEVDADGNETYILQIEAITVLGCTIVPFPAIGSTTIDFIAASAAEAPITRFQSVSSGIEWAEDDGTAEAVGELLALVASGPRPFPAEMFDNPGFADPSPVRVLPADVDGNHRIIGHLALFDQCHIGFRHCELAPRSASGYAYFLTGQVTLAEGGYQRVGTLTLSGLHADQHLGPREAQAHYDNTALAAAYVNVGEDDFGIWISGVVKPGLDESKATEVMAAGGLSGDWRRIGGHMELIAAHAVNTPGFPILGFSDNDQISLVASGYGHADRTKAQVSVAVDRVHEEMVAQLAVRDQTIADLTDQLDALADLIRPMLSAQARARLAAAVDA